MDEGKQAVSSAEAPVTDSAPVEESTVEESMETSEKTEITQEDAQDNPTEEASDSKEPQAIPKDRFDEVVKERNELRELKANIEAEKLEKEKAASFTPEQQMQEQQTQKAKDALRKLGVVTQEDLEVIQKQETAKNMFISEMNRLESEHNGKDGMPKAVPQDIAEYMDSQMQKGNQISDPETAYRLMHFDAIVDAKAKSQKSSAYSEKQAGGVQEVDDKRQSELKAAKESGDMTRFLKKYAPMPK